MTYSYISNDTIVALSSAAGRAAISIIRMSGEDAFSIINKVFKTNSNFNKQVRYGHIISLNETIDEVICVFFKSPHTYTGENLVEICVHGNPLIVNSVLELLCNTGARLASPGEFTYRSFLNGKKDLIEAESVCDIISSKTSKSTKFLLNNISGVFSSKIKKIKNSLTMFLAFINASIDYPDENISTLSYIKKIDFYIKDIQNILDNYKISNILQHGIKIPIIGKPNVGKSSLLNSILGKNRVIVTDIPGTTTDIIEETIDYKGIQLTFVDTAGIRNITKDIIESLGQEKTKCIIKESKILIVIFDISSYLDKDDFKIMQFLKKNAPSCASIIAVFNKIDLLKNDNFDYSVINDLFVFTVKISAKKQLGIVDLLDKIISIIGADEHNNDFFMINSRHHILLQNVLCSLKKAKDILFRNNNNVDEIIYIEIENAQKALNEILGIGINQDVLDTIFSTFCIGK
jgi:tRNA modification GTPase